ARGRFVLGEEVADVALGRVVRRREVRGEVRDDFHAILEVPRELLRALGEREDAGARAVEAAEAEARGEHVEQDEDACRGDDEERGLTPRTSPAPGFFLAAHDVLNGSAGSRARRARGGRRSWSSS